MGAKPDNIPTIRVITEEDYKNQGRVYEPKVTNTVDQNRLRVPEMQITMAPTDRKINQGQNENSYLNTEYSGVLRRNSIVPLKIRQKLISSQLDIKLIKKPVVVPQWEKVPGFDSQQFKTKIIVPFQISCKFPEKNIVRDSQYFDQSSNDLDLKTNQKRQLTKITLKEPNIISQVSQNQSNFRHNQKSSAGYYNSTITINSSKLNIKDLQTTEIGKSTLSIQEDPELDNKMVRQFELAYENSLKQPIKNSNYFDESFNAHIPIESTSNPDLLNFGTGQILKRRTFVTQTYLFDRSLNSKIET